MANLAIHDALNAIERKYQPYAYDKKAEAGTSVNAAVASAAYHVMAPTMPRSRPKCFRMPSVWRMPRPSSKAPMLGRWLVIPDGPAKDKGIALGKATAEAVLAKRANDHADDGGPYINKTCPPPARPASINARRSAPSSLSRNGKTSRPSC